MNLDLCYIDVVSVCYLDNIYIYLPSELRSTWTYLYCIKSEDCLFLHPVNLSRFAGLEFNSSLLEVTDLDYVGPLPSVPTQERDYLLWLSWIFIISFSSYMFSRSHTGLRLWNYVNSFGAVHEHHHID